jgi:hypothetical protein
MTEVGRLVLLITRGAPVSEVLDCSSFDTAYSTRNPLLASYLEDPIHARELFDLAAASTTKFLPSKFRSLFNARTSCMHNFYVGCSETARHAFLCLDLERPYFSGIIWNCLTRIGRPNDGPRATQVFTNLRHTGIQHQLVDLCRKPQIIPDSLIWRLFVYVVGEENLARFGIKPPSRRQFDPPFEYPAMPESERVAQDC